MNINESRRIASASSGGTSASHLYRLFLQTALSVPNIELHVLDFGAGTGVLTNFLLTSGRHWHITAMDLMPHPDGLSPNVDWIQQDLNEPSSFPSAKFDLIVACEVIEHLENPRFISREWFRMLRPGGTIILSTPNNESLRALLSFIFRGHFTYFVDHSYPAHITALLAKDINRCLAEAGFIDIRIVYSDVGAIPALTRFTWQQTSFGLLKGCRFSDNVVAVGVKPK
jgi:2-polyprenyl-3-methyl-5-hydroxy-6-metoxy-1,4-benzoquinol methylase